MKSVACKIWMTQDSERITEAMIMILYFLCCPINIHLFSGAIINLFQLMSQAWRHMPLFLPLMEAGRALWVLCQPGQPKQNKKQQEPLYCKELVITASAVRLTSVSTYFVLHLSFTVGAYVCLCHGTCGGQRTACGSLFFPFYPVGPRDWT